MAVRRNLRLRREYLYAKSLEGKEKDLYDRKQRIKAALAEGKSIPTELRTQAESLKHDLDLEHAHMKPKSHLDDEYDPSGMTDPKVCVTTSRDPSSRLKQFAKEIRMLFPNSQRVNRGSHKTEELVGACRGNGFTDIVVLHETRGEPDGFIISHLPHGPTVSFSLSNVVLRHDIEDKASMSEAFPHLILNNFTSKLGERLATVLKHCFPAPKPDSKRVITFSNDSDYISFRHHTFTKSAGSSTVELHEVGPRFELRPFRIMLGALDQPDADNEWVMRPYMNTAKKKDVL